MSVGDSFGRDYFAQENPYPEEDISSYGSPAISSDMEQFVNQGATPEASDFESLINGLSQRLASEGTTGDPEALGYGTNGASGVSGGGRGGGGASGTARAHARRRGPAGGL